MSQINVSNLTFGYDGSYDTIFDKVSFQLDTNWKLGFTGRNGKGKTTFLKLLMGQYEYSGTIAASVEFSYFPFEVKQKERNTIELVDALSGNYEFWELQRELSMLEVDYDVLYRPFSTLSQGEQTKVLLAVLFLRENQFLLIDEPTNHLDMASRELVGQYLNSKRGFILVSHDRYFLDQCVDHILSINNTSIEVQRGSYSSWMENKARQDQYELGENEKLKKEIKKMTTAARRTAGWSDAVEKTKKGASRKLVAGLKPDRGYVGHKAAKMMKRSKATEARKEKAVQEKSKLLKNIDWAGELAIKTLSYPKSRLVEVRNLSIAYGAAPVFENVSFDVNQGDRVALKGRNGCGKSSILKAVLGEEIPHSGELMVGTQLECSCVSQDTAFLTGSLRAYIRDNSLDESLFKAILRKLGFSREQFDKGLEAYSSGQKKKVLLAASLCRPAHLYIWDEPLNFIDVLSRVQIENLICQYEPTMLFVEHDRMFMEHVATKVVTLQAP
ncbi:ribosomal protection-like ABC-F family protein [Eubacterium sp. 1001713B170207_170306_E7]|uniref:ribosomal protection-like ABC-F family protein n=1 Tax=Eubacterium sp. 1001713B170207_170306_E7 TaxID=2787097 RepID=UPI00189A49B2|nr:ABC-F type ribosomal protection protein [Eubacterium sp. 1001713B170207_170306_E7]